MVEQQQFMVLPVHIFFILLLNLPKVLVYCQFVLTIRPRGMLLTLEIIGGLAAADWCCWDYWFGGYDDFNRNLIGGASSMLTRVFERLLINSWQLRITGWRFYHQSHHRHQPNDQIRIILNRPMNHQLFPSWITIFMNLLLTQVINEHLRKVQEQNKTYMNRQCHKLLLFYHLFYL